MVVGKGLKRKEVYQVPTGRLADITELVVGGEHDEDLGSGHFW